MVKRKIKTQLAVPGSPGKWLLKRLQRVKDILVSGRKCSFVINNAFHACGRLRMEERTCVGN